MYFIYFSTCRKGNPLFIFLYSRALRLFFIPFFISFRFSERKVVSGPLKLSAGGIIIPLCDLGIKRTVRVVLFVKDRVWVRVSVVEDDLTRWTRNNPLAMLVWEAAHPRIDSKPRISGGIAIIYELWTIVLRFRHDCGRFLPRTMPRVLNSGGLKLLFSWIYANLLLLCFPAFHSSTHNIYVDSISLLLAL